MLSNGKGNNPSVQKHVGDCEQDEMKVTDQLTVTSTMSNKLEEEQDALVNNRHDDGDDGDDPINCDVLRPFPLFAWVPDPDLSDDENYMDLIMILTRSSICLQGCMACVLVRPPPQRQQKQDDDGQVDSTEMNTNNILEENSPPKSASTFRLRSAIIAAATNQPLYTECDSDVHAEVAALGQAARLGRATEGCTAYITMPPCTRCFAALTVSGITRIVTRRSTFHKDIPTAALKRNVELVDLSSSETQRRERVEQLVSKATVMAVSATSSQRSNGDNSEGNILMKHSDDTQQRIAEQRKRKKEVKQIRKQNKTTARLGGGGNA